MNYNIILLFCAFDDSASKSDFICFDQPCTYFCYRRDFGRSTLNMCSTSVFVLVLVCDVTLFEKVFTQKTGDVWDNLVSFSTTFFCPVSLAPRAFFSFCLLVYWGVFIIELANSCVHTDALLNL